MATTEHPALLSLREVSKSYGAVQALRAVHLDLHGGEVHGLVGENGAGKSTLVKVLAGVHRPDTGEVLLDGAPLVLHGPADIGYLAGYAGAALSAGQVTGAEGEKFTAGRLGDCTIGEAGEVVLGPPTTFTAGNIDDFDF